MQRSKRIPFTDDENQIIRDSVKIYGEDWEAIAKKLHGRTPKQIHDRYINYLRDGLKKEPWTKQEDDILIEMYKSIGSKWSKMMTKLPGRSGNDIKNRWHKHLFKNVFTPIEFNDLNSLEINFDEIDSCDLIQNNQQNSSFKNNYGPDPTTKSGKDNFPCSCGLLKQNVIFPFGEKESGIKQKSQIQMVDFPKNLNTNSACSSISNQFHQKNQKIESKYQTPVKLINKTDIYGNQIKTNQLNSIQDFNHAIFKTDFDINYFIEDLGTQKMDFPWI